MVEPSTANPFLFLELAAASIANPVETNVEAAGTAPW